MNFLATTQRLLVVVVLIGFPALMQAQIINDSGTVQLELFGDGFVGRSCIDGGFGFIFNDINSIFEGQLIVGISDSQVSGEAYALCGMQGPIEYANISGPSALTPPFDEPYEEFDEGYESTFDDSVAPAPLGIDVTERSYSSSAAPDNTYIIQEYTIANTTGADITDAYVGLFTDFDILSTLDNFCDYDAGTQLLYCWESNPAVSDYSGAAILGTAVVSGYNDNTGAGANPTEADLYDSMTNGGVPPACEGDDCRTVIGAGPYTIPAGGDITIMTAYVAGIDEADIIANAAAAQAAVFVIPPAVEPNPDGTPGTHNLSAVYPNPFNPQANFTLEVAEQQSVRIAVYDALGREVAMLFNGTLSAGPEHAFTIDGAGFPSGVYMVRAMGEQFTDVRRVTLMK